MNKKMRIALIYIMVLIIIAVGDTICFLLSVPCGIIMLIVCVLVTTVFSVYLYNRYKDIKNISSYLTELVNGTASLKIDDNSEGELSILTNNIYKTAKKLQSQTELLLKDKKWLADSLADISHQLKTPITSMTVMTDLLGDEDLPDDKRRQFLDNIAEELKKMQWMIVTLLKISKFDAGTIELKSEKVSLVDIINDSVRPFLIQAELRNISINLKLENAYFIGDSQWTTEAIRNIIKNCIEHIDDGGILDIECSQTPVFGRIFIKDNGCGIAKDELPHIFERFYKGKNSSSDSVGIGLALSKSVFNREKALVEAKSEVGIGTSFEIKFYTSTI